MKRVSTILALYFLLLSLPAPAHTVPAPLTSGISQSDTHKAGILQQAEQEFAEAESLRSQGKAASLKGAIIKYEHCLALRRSINDRKGEAITLNRIGLVYLGLREGQKALDHLVAALPLWRNIRDDHGEAENLTNQGGAYYLLADYKKAIQFYKQAIPIWIKLHDPQAIAQILKNIGATYFLLGEMEDALAYSQQAANLWGSLNNKPLEKASSEVVNKVFSFYKSKIKVTPKGTSLLSPISLCRAYFLSNQWDRADECYSSFIKLASSFVPTKPLNPGRATGVDSLDAILRSVGRDYMSWGEYQKALNYVNQAMALSRQTTDLVFLGNLYDFLGDPEISLEFYKQALSNADGRNTFIKAEILAAMGKAYLSMSDYQRSLECYSQAMPILPSNDKEVVARALTGLALLYKELGDKDRALYHLNQALYRVAEDPALEANILINIASILHQSGDRERAIDYYRRTLIVSQIAADVRGQAAALYGIADVQHEWGNYPEALELIELAINKIEELRVNAPGYRSRASFFASVQDYYKLYIDLLMELNKSRPDQGYERKAFSAFEKSQARTLLEQINESSIDIRQGVDPDILKRERDLQTQLSAKADLQLRILAGIEAPPKAFTLLSKTPYETVLEQEIQKLTASYEAIQEQIRASNKQYVSLRRPKPLAINEIQEKILDPGTLLLAYSLGKDHSYLWAVSKTSITTHELPRREVVESAATRFYALLTEPKQPRAATDEGRGLQTKTAGQSKAISDPAAFLTNILLEPVAARLENKRLIIVADGALQYVPFAALPDPVASKGTPTSAEPLVIRHEIVSLPSASTIDVLRKELAGRKQADRTLAVLADPVFDLNDPRVQSKRQVQPGTEPASDVRGVRIKKSAAESGIIQTGQPIPRLIGTRREAERILALVPPEERFEATGFLASRRTATSPELKNYRILHFATHGFINSANPELSGILLSMVNEQGVPQDGLLQSHEIYNLRLPAELVVLSACQTALGKQIRGEGVVGLTRGFMYAGAARVVASLWKVDDDATSELMVKFYRGVLKEGLSPAAALRAAQIAMFKEKQWEHPYYWAAFVLQGEWL